MAKKPFVFDSDEELIEAFKFFDPNKNDQQAVPVMNIESLKMSMTTFGEKLSEEEVKVMIQFADPQGEQIINYEDFARLLLSK